jgi:hypothetical protein
VLAWIWERLSGSSSSSLNHWRKYAFWPSRPPFGCSDFRHGILSFQCLYTGTPATEGCLLKIYVGNLNPTTDDALLRQTFTSHGEVTTASIVRDRETQTSRGFGFIEMPGSPEAQAAIAALNGSTLDGKLLVVNEARARETGPREVRSGSSAR